MTRTDNNTIAQDIRFRIEYIQKVTEHLNPEQVIYHIYDNFFPIKLPPDPSDETLSELDRRLEKLAEILPEQHADLLSLSNELSLPDIDQILLYATALRKQRGETVWFHYSLATILNGLVLAGVAVARTPCVLHAILALQHQSGDRHHEPLTRSILAREIAEIAPRDAIRQGIEALELGYSPPCETVLAAAASLGIVHRENPPRPSISVLDKIARHCALRPPRDNPPVSMAGSDPNLTAREVIGAEQVRLPRPTPDGSYYLFRSAETEINVPSVSVYDIPGGIVSFDITASGRTEFYVFDSDGRCLEDLSHGIRPFVHDKLGTSTDPIAVAGDAFSGSMNLSHFLLDQLTRLAIYKKYLGYIPRFLLPDDYPYYRSVLSIAGLAENAVIPQEKRFSIRADRLLFASNIESLVHPAHLGAPWALDFLREILPTGRAGARNAARKIFVSRADARSRRILNRQPIEQIVSQRGYEVMVLSGMTVREQMMAFGEASHVVGVHGAGLTNILFCAPGARVLEILPALCATNAYWILSAAAGHHYRAVIADDPELPRPDYSSWSHRPECNNRDVVIPPERLLAALDLLEHA